ILAALLVAPVVDTARVVERGSKAQEPDGKCTAQDVLYAEGAPAGFENENPDVLSSHKLLASLAPGVDPSALVTCYNLHRQSDRWRLSWKQKLADKLIQAGRATLDSSLRKSLLWPVVKGVLGLRKGSLATDLLTWAFEHEDGKNPFCMKESDSAEKKMMLRR
ncbi:ROM3, partial [Symbiodinium pilosum]